MVICHFNFSTTSTFFSLLFKRRYHPSVGEVCPCGLSFTDGLRLLFHVVQGLVSRKEAVVSALTHFIVGRIVEECAEKGMTQNTRHNRSLSAPACTPMLIPPLPRSHIPMAASVVQRPRLLGVCVLARGRGSGGVEAWRCSLFIPGSQLTHEVMVVTLSPSIPLCPRPLIHRCVKCVDDGERWYAAMCWSRRPPPVRSRSRRTEGGWVGREGDADFRDRYASSVMLEALVRTGRANA